MERYAITCRPAAPEITVSSQVFSQEEEGWLSLTVRHISLLCFYTSFNQASWQKYILIYNASEQGALIVWWDTSSASQYNHRIILQATEQLHCSSRGFLSTRLQTCMHDINVHTERLFCIHQTRIYRYSVAATCFQSDKFNLIIATKTYWPKDKINHLCTFHYLAPCFSVGPLSLLLDRLSCSTNQHFFQPHL